MDLNPEQRKLVEVEPHGHALIRGVAGSGKTTVALHRALFLRQHYCYGDSDRILLVMYNKSLQQYLKYLYDKLKDLNYNFNIFSGAETKVDIRTVDSIIYKHVDEAGCTNNEALNNNQKRNLLKECIVELRKALDHPILDQKNANFLLNEIEWIKACNYMELEEYQSVERVGRQRYESGESPQKLAKDSPARRAIYELMLLYNKRLSDNGYIDFLDRALAAFKGGTIKEEEKYTHIIVDESQDLTRGQLAFLKRLYADQKHSSFTFVMDTAQSIYPHAWLVKGRSFSSIGFDMSGRSSSLRKSYRNTEQIARSAYRLIESDDNITADENYVVPLSIDKQGCDPVYRCFESSREEADYIKESIRELLAGQYAYKDIAVIARLNNQLDYLQENFQEAGIPCHRPKKNDSDFHDNAVNLLTLHAIKGLEFKAVFIIGLTDRVMPYIPNPVEHEDSDLQESNERKLLYVGMTRATEMLFLSSSGTPTRFLKFIDTEHLRFNHRGKIKGFYEVKHNDYLYKEKLVSEWSNEEKVRQWMLQELLHTYRYPRSLIEIEYKVSSFSQVGSVDIAVHMYKKGVRAPFIFVEAKAPGSDLAGGLKQLESYMSHSLTCRYGVLTDGREVVVINRDAARVDDIPVYDSSGPPPSLEEYYYMEIRSPRRFNFIIDGNAPEVIIEKTGEAEKEYCAAELIKIPVFESIAAGAPAFMSEQADNEFCLPREWVKAKDRLFMLRVQGDSMVGVDIYDGDYVLVRKQNTAENTDIVVVALEEEATLKEFMRIGDQVLLIPKNKKYTPQKIETEQARVLGIVLGIVKPVKAETE